jgi:predicted DNA-binding antitoxin AbrB/MazE fold protein
MAYRGHFENGVVVFDEPVDLPEGAPVRVERSAVRQGNSEPEAQENEDRIEDEAWSRFSLASAMRGMEEEESPYTLDDLKETFR